MDFKKRLGVQFLLLLLLAIAIWLSVMLAPASALSDNRPDYTIKVEFYYEETGAQIRYTEMVIGVKANAGLLDAIQEELGTGWINLYQDEFHQAGQLTGDLNRFVTAHVVVKVVYPLAIFTSSASRLST